MGKNDNYKLSEVPEPNYDAWEFRTRSEARDKGLLETILGQDSEPQCGHSTKTWKGWKAKRDAASNLLVKLLDDDQLIHIRGLDDDPAAMWERLRSIHQKTGVTGSAAELWTRFHGAIYNDPHIPLRTHIGKLRAYAEALERLHDDKPSNTQIISRIFISLPESYSTTIKILELHKRSDDLDFIVEEVLKEETKQQAAKPKPSSDSDSVRALAAFQRPPKSSIICETPSCKAIGRTGHLTENCFWPGGGKEGQWPDWWFRRGESSSSTVTPTSLSATVVGQSFVL